MRNTRRKPETHKETRVRRSFTQESWWLERCSPEPSKRASAQTFWSLIRQYCPRGHKSRRADFISLRKENWCMVPGKREILGHQLSILLTNIACPTSRLDDFMTRSTCQKFIHVLSDPDFANSFVLFYCFFHRQGLPDGARVRVSRLRQFVNCHTSPD